MSGVVCDIALNDLVVVKRSGQRVGFNTNKIAIAIKKAFDYVRQADCEKQINKVYEDVLEYINNNYNDRKTINVEDIQDIIENKLKENKYEDVYLAFSDYRIRRAASRKAFGIKQQHKFAKAIERIVNNKDCFNNKPNYILLDFGKTIACEYTKTYVLDNKFVRAHEEGSIYIHNLDYYNLGKLSSTHMIFDNITDEFFFDKIITNALCAKDEIDGEVAIDSLDYLLQRLVISSFKCNFKEKLKKYLTVGGYLEYLNIKKIEELIDKEDSISFDIDLFSSFVYNRRVRDIFEIAYNDSMEFVMNFLNTNIKKMFILLEDNYKENKKFSISLGSNDSFEGLIINNLVLKVINELDKLHNVMLIFKVKKNTNLELLNKVSELVINDKNICFSFIDNSYNKNNYEEVEYFSNGKRIFENDIYDDVGSKGRMIVSSVSINMGRLGLKYSGKDIKDFYIEFDELLDLSRNCLVSIFETIGDKNKDNYQIIFNNNIIDDDKLESGQKIRKVIKKGVLNIELAGLYECVLCLEEDITKQRFLIEEIIDYAYSKSKKYTTESKLNFVVSETSKHRPLKKLMELDKAIYGILKNVTDKEMYKRIDNMFNSKEDVVATLSYIGKYQKKFSGGCLVKLLLPKNVTVKKIGEYLNLAMDSDVGFLKLEVRK